MKEQIVKIDPKPIFIIEFPNHADIEYCKEVTESLIQKIKDYHVVSFIGMSDDVKFGCFNAKNIAEINYEELKSLIEKSIKI